MTMNPPAKPPPEGMLDPVAIGRLQALDPDGRNGVVRRVLATFDGSLARHLGELRAELERCDAVTVSGIAHTLKSSSASVGALRLAAVCEEVERRTRGSGAPAQRHDVERLIAEGEAALVAVRAMLTSP